MPNPLDSYQKSHFVAAFAQDKWRVTNRATLSLGLRYDLEVQPIAELDNPSFLIRRSIHSIPTTSLRELGSPMT